MKPLLAAETISRVLNKKLSPRPASSIVGIILVAAILWLTGWWAYSYVSDTSERRLERYNQLRIVFDLAIASSVFVLTLLLLRFQGKRRPKAPQPRLIRFAILFALYYRQVLRSRQAVANHKRKEPPVLRQVADGVLIHESEFCQSNAVVVQGRAGVLLIDPGILGSEMVALADDLRELGQPVVAGFSTHPHWDHLLWHARLGEPPRYGTARCAATVRERLPDARAKARVAEMIPPDIAQQVPLDLLGLITGLPAETAQIPWDGPQVRIIEHQAHAPGHAALLIEARRVLVAGDMLSDVLIPMLDLNAADLVDDYLAALRLLEGVAGDVDVVIPGHGSVGGADQVHARIDQDRAYVHALRDAGVPDDPRVGPSAKDGWDWVAGVHERQLQRLAQRSERDGTPV